jgi:hypothetical protein
MDKIYWIFIIIILLIIYYLYQKKLNAVCKHKTQMESYQHIIIRDNSPWEHNKDADYEGGNTSQNENCHHYSNYKFNRENFSVKNEPSCDLDSSKKFIYNEIKSKYLERIRLSSEKIKSLKEKLDSLNNQIKRINKDIDFFSSYAGNFDEYQANKLRNLIPDLSRQIVLIQNELTYLASYDIEFKQLQDEMLTSPLPSSSP